jgi:hypothetical protein
MNKLKHAYSVKTELETCDLYMLIQKMRLPAQSQSLTFLLCYHVSKTELERIQKTRFAAHSQSWTSSDIPT